LLLAATEVSGAIAPTTSPSTIVAVIVPAAESPTTGIVIVADQIGGHATCGRPVGGLARRRGICGRSRQVVLGRHALSCCPWLELMSFVIRHEPGDTEQEAH
jgi:hypothetical protein